MSLAMLYQPTLDKIKSTMKSVLKIENNILNGNLFFLCNDNKYLLL